MYIGTFKGVSISMHGIELLLLCRAHYSGMRYEPSWVTPEYPSHKVGRGQIFDVHEHSEDSSDTGDKEDIGIPHHPSTPRT